MPNEEKCSRLIFALSWRARLLLADQIAKKADTSADDVTDGQILGHLYAVIMRRLIAGRCFEEPRENVPVALFKKGGAAA